MYMKKKCFLDSERAKEYVSHGYTCTMICLTFFVSTVLSRFRAVTVWQSSTLRVVFSRESDLVDT